MRGTEARRVAVLQALAAIWLGTVGLAAAPPANAESAASDPEAAVTVHLSGVDQEVVIEPSEDGSSMEFVLQTPAGPERLAPDEFARRVYEEQTRQPWWKKIFNITSLAGLLWVGLGLLGQALFTGRMLVQWIVSERRRRSVVPIAFWWLSLIGASMLLVYFVWRKDIVGVLGQAVGWIVYVRNLRLLYRGDESETPSREGLSPAR